MYHLKGRHLKSTTLFPRRFKELRPENSRMNEFKGEFKEEDAISLQAEDIYSCINKNKLIKC